MLFSSVSFLYYFLPITIALYFVVPKKWKNAVLLFASLFFYFYGEPKYLLLMVFACLSGYIHGLLIEKYRGTKRAKGFLISSIVVSVAILGVFKYADMFVGTVNGVFGANTPLLGLALPIGISFYTFQMLSYTIDVYRGAAAQRNFIDFSTYLALFPQLIAGPIVRYVSIAEQLKTREHTTEKIAGGITRFAVGLAKKVLIANTLAELALALKNLPQQSVLGYWVIALAFTLQIYFDFSGYSDMAIGLGKLFGFDFPENFDYPYASKSVTEFWRRWHMTLGQWFRDYVYIPLGGNRVSRARWLFNILVVWLLTGLWHGAEWNFVVWGLYYALFLVLEKLVFQRFWDKIPNIIKRIYTLLVVIIGFVIFNANGMADALTSLGGMFGAGGIVAATKESAYYSVCYVAALVVAIVGCTPLMKNIATKFTKNIKAEKVANVLQPIFVGVLLVLVTAYLVDGSFNPFLYFRF